MDGGRRVAPVRDALDGQTHGPERQHGGRGANGQPLAVVQVPVGEAEAIHLQRLPKGGQRFRHHERRLPERRRRLVAIDQRLEGGAGKMNRPGPVRLSLEQFAIRQAQYLALRYRPQEIASFETGPRRRMLHLRPVAAIRSLRRAGGIRHRRAQPPAADSVVRLGKCHFEIRDLETGLGEDIRQRSRSPKQSRPMNARQRNPTGLERRVGGIQGDRLSDQAIGAHRIIQFTDSQRAPGMRCGKRSLGLRFAVVIEDCTTEHKDKPRDGEDERTQEKANVGRPPPQRPPSATLHRACVNPVFWQTTNVHEGSISRARRRGGVVSKQE